MSYSRSLHRQIDSDLVAQIESKGRVTRIKRGAAKSFRHKAQRNAKPEVKHRPFTGPIRKNQRRTEYFA